MQHVAAISINSWWCCLLCLGRIVPSVRKLGRVGLPKASQRRHAERHPDILAGSYAPGALPALFFFYIFGL